MKAAPASARILVATDNADDARQIAKQLSQVFDDVRSSTVEADATADFEALPAPGAGARLRLDRQGAAVLPGASTA